MTKCSFKSILGHAVATALVLLAASVPAMAAGGSLADNVRQSLGSYASGIAIRTDGDRVFLAGQVGTDQERHDVLQRAAKTPGVRIVHDNIEAIGGSNNN